MFEKAQLSDNFIKEKNRFLVNNLSELTKYYYMENHHLKFLFDDKIGSPNNSDAFYFIRFLYQQESDDIET